MKKKFNPPAGVWLIVCLALSACSRLNPAPSPSALPSTATPHSATAAATGLTLSPTPALTRGTIRIWHSWDEAQIPALLQIIDDFHAQYPDVQFDVLYVPIEDLRSRYETAVREGGGPSILLGPASWGPPLYDAGLLSDLSADMDARLLDSLNPAALGAGRYKGALIGLPYALQGVVLYRNALIVPEAPETFDSLVSDAHFATRGETVGAVLERGFLYSGGDLISLGGQVMDENGNPAFNNERGLAWIQLLQTFEQVGPTELNSDQDLELFKLGKVGFIIDGTWNMNDLSQALGPGNLAVDPWPTYDQNGAHYHLSGFVQSDQLYLSPLAQGDSREASLKFIAYFLSPDVQASLAEAGRIPAALGFPVKDSLIEQAMQALAGGVTYPPLPEMETYTAPMNAALKTVFDGQTSPSKALQSAQDNIQEALDQFHATPTP